jgi:hypothetical protein
MTALLLALALRFAQEKPVTEKARIQERVTVDRVVISGRVIDRFANPISGLVAGDFRLRVDERDATIESVEWIPPRPRSEQSPVVAKTEVEALESDFASKGSAPAGQPTLATPFRTIIMLFQWEIAGQKDTGFVRMMRQAERLVESSDAEDRIAVFGFGSSLKLLQDLTTDHAALLDAIEAVRSWKLRSRPASASGPTLSTAVADCQQAASIQKAIVCIGKSLQTLPGPKTLLFFGWTIASRRNPPRVEYREMVEAIGKAQTSVWVLDVSDGKHTLASGLARLALDTGGLYNGGCIYETMYCADLIRLKVHRAVEGGVYELVFRDPAFTPGWHQVDITLTGRGGTALFPRWYRDGPDVSSK